MKTEKQSSESESEAQGKLSVSFKNHLTRMDNGDNIFYQVARGGHRKGVLATHTCCAGGTWYVDLAEEEMKKTLGKHLFKFYVDSFTAQLHAP